MEHGAIDALPREVLSLHAVSAPTLMRWSPLSRGPARTQRLDGTSGAVDLAGPIPQSDEISSSYMSAPRDALEDVASLTVDEEYKDDVKSMAPCPTSSAMAPSPRQTSPILSGQEDQIEGQPPQMDTPAKSVSASIESMISSEDQCRVASPPPLTTSPPPMPVAMSFGTEYEVDDNPPIDLEVDEGFFEASIEDDIQMERVRNAFRRSSDLARIRKSAAGEDVVFHRPRMRRKITRRRRQVA